jgi:hypothetical protein
MKGKFGKYPITEVLVWDGKAILYSEDEAVFNWFKSDPQALNFRAFKRDGVYVGGDVEFLKEYKQTLERRLKNNRKIL